MADLFDRICFSAIGDRSRGRGLQRMAGLHDDDRRVFNIIFVTAYYSPERPGLHPAADFLLGGFVFCMFDSSGVWGALAPIFPRHVVVGGALTTSE